MADDPTDSMAGDMVMTSFSVQISIDEWLRLLDGFYLGLSLDERLPTGHLLLECSGTRRTWVATNGSTWMIAHGEGPAPTGLADRNEPVSILVNSRFFRTWVPDDMTLTVTSTGDGRRQTMHHDGVEVDLPEHPGSFPEWRTAVAGITGTDVVLDADQLFRACRSAAVEPMGVDKAQPVQAWLYGQDGHLVLHTPWVRFPDTVVRIVTERPVPDTVPALIAPEVLAELVQHLESARITLTLPPTALQPIGVRAVDFQAVLVPIDRWSAERSGLEKLLREFRKVETVFADDDGDYPILTAEGNHLWVRLRTDRDPVSVEVFSVLATDVEGTEDLLRELNAMNADGAYVRVVWSNGAVLAEHDLVAATLDLTELANAVEVVSSTADRYRGVLSAFFGPGGTVTDDVGIQDL